MSKLTVSQLIKDKEKYQVKDDTKAEISIERLDASITIQKPSRSLCMEAMQMTTDENQAEKADIFMVYNTVIEPNLKDSKLQKEFGCVEPDDIVAKIFEIGEISQIATAAMDLAGYNSGVKRINDIKN